MLGPGRGKASAIAGRAAGETFSAGGCRDEQERLQHEVGVQSVFFDLAIDLGTANTLVFAHGKGIVVNEPSIRGHQQVQRRSRGCGPAKQKKCSGARLETSSPFKPMKDGVIADFKVTEKMLTYFIQKAHNRRVLVHPRIVIGVPSEITPVEKRAVQDSAYRARASEVFLVEQAMAAAIGAGLPIEEPSGNMVVDIGGGTTDIAVISMSGIVYSRSVRVAGNEMDEAVMQYLKRKYNLLVGERTAEQIKMEIGSAYPLEKTANHGSERPQPYRGCAANGHHSTTARFAKPSANVSQPFSMLYAWRSSARLPSFPPTSATAESC